MVSAGGVVVSDGGIVELSGAGGVDVPAPESAGEPGAGVVDISLPAGPVPVVSASSFRLHPAVATRAAAHRIIVAVLIECMRVSFTR